MQFPEWNRLVRLYEREIRRLFPATLTEQELYRLANSQEFQEAAYRAAKRMVTGVASANARSWRAAAAKSTRAREIFNALRSEIDDTPLGHAIRSIVRENARLISSLPLDMAQRVTAYAAKQQQAGQRSDVIEKELRRWAPHLTASRIRLIARTEVGKSETALTRARAEAIDIHWGQWTTSHDVRVRPSHRNLDGVLMNFDDPPQPEALIGEKSNLGRGLAGEFPNCRCIILPLISLDEVAWPARVYAAGSIRRMSRAQFTRAVGIPLAA